MSFDWRVRGNRKALAKRLCAAVPEAVVYGWVQRVSKRLRHARHSTCTVDKSGECALPPGSGGRCWVCGPCASCEGDKALDGTPAEGAVGLVQRQCGGVIGDDLVKEQGRSDHDHTRASAG